MAIGANFSKFKWIHTVKKTLFSKLHFFSPRLILIKLSPKIFEIYFKKVKYNSFADIVLF